MKEIQPRAAWHRVKIEGGYIQVREVDPKIQAKMPPPGRKTYIEVGIIESFVNEVKRLLRGEQNTLG